MDKEYLFYGIASEFATKREIDALDLPPHFPKIFPLKPYTHKYNKQTKNMIRFIVVFFVCMATVVVIHATTLPAAQIFEIYPKYGSFAGGTYLNIKGVGWSRGGVGGTTQAFLNINGVLKPCVQNQAVILDSTDKNFVCWTPPLLDVGVRPRFNGGWYTVVVILTALDGTTRTATCSGSCQFGYRSSATPIVGYASLGGYAGSVLKAYGRFHDPNGVHYWMRVGGDNAGGGVGGALCVVDQKLQVNSLPFVFPKP